MIVDLICWLKDQHRQENIEQKLWRQIDIVQNRKGHIGDRYQSDPCHKKQDRIRKAKTFGKKLDSTGYHEQDQDINKSSHSETKQETKTMFLFVLIMWIM